MMANFCLILLLFLSQGSSGQIQSYDIAYVEENPFVGNAYASEVPNDLLAFDSTDEMNQFNFGLESRSSRSFNNRLVECKDKIEDFNFARTNEFDRYEFNATTDADGMYLKKLKCKFSIAVPSGKKMYIYIRYLDIFTENPSKCDKKGDFMSIKAPGKKFTLCGQDQDKLLEIGPFSKPAKVKFLFKSNKDGNSGAGIGLYLHANRIRTFLGSCGKPDYFESSKRTVPVELQPSPLQLQRLLDARKTEEIVGGNTADKYEYPWQAALLTNGGGFCGGTLVADQWIVTAFHCIDANGMVAYLHAHDLTNTNDVVAVPVSEIRLPSNAGFPTYDIALLKLESPVPLSTELYPACIIGPDFDYGVCTAVVTSGWGSMTFYNGSIATVLQELDMIMGFQDMCARFAGGAENYDAEHIICTFPMAGQGVCAGDSGGPLIDYYIYEHAHLVGVTSFITGECGTTPSYYAKVQPAIDWIKQTVLNN